VQAGIIKIGRRLVLKKGLKGLKAVAFVVVAAVAALYYYIELPAINIHSPGFWKFIIFVMLIVTVEVWLMNHRKAAGGGRYRGNISAKEFFSDFKTQAGCGLFFFWGPGFFKF